MTTTNADLSPARRDYSRTVFLPSTSFSMRGDLTKKEPGILEAWAKMDLYGRMLEKRRAARPFILHDGPPYANGPIHIGTALNKILKDMVVKSHALMGYYSPYVPGWDCHGLPIEQALLKEMKMGKRHIDDIPAFRRSAREFAGRFLDIQREGFKRLGVLAAWDKPYITMSNSYEGTVIRAFRELLEKGHIHRDKKTIYWCVSCETALADAEVEYADKTSPSIYVRFPCRPCRKGRPPMRRAAPPSSSGPPRRGRCPPIWRPPWRRPRTTGCWRPPGSCSSWRINWLTLSLRLQASKR